MDQATLTSLLERLIVTWKNEVVEFKRAGTDYDTDRIGQYFSALGNEANLRGERNAVGWSSVWMTSTARWSAVTTARSRNGCRA